MAWSISDTRTIRADDTDENTRGGITKRVSTAGGNTESTAPKVLQRMGGKQTQDALSSISPELVAWNGAQSIGNSVNRCEDISSQRQNEAIVYTIAQRRIP